MNRSYNAKLFIVELALVLFALLYLTPFYFVIANSVKPFKDILINAASWPATVEWGNYLKAWQLLNFPMAFWNSFIIVLFGNLGIIVLSSMSAYWISRNRGAANSIMLVILLSAMIIPFQTIMIPLIRVASFLDMTNSRWGVILCYWGLGVSMAVFMYHNFIKSLPIEIEEAAIVDGCGPLNRFWRVIFPLLKPMTVTLAILDTLWIWNDFLLPSLFLNNVQMRTIPLASSMLFSQYTKQWDLGLAALVMACAPIVIFFFSLQSYIIKGVAAGSVKG
jgi:raffinose/stachyose/melibiose transport system permease protein